MSESKTLEAMRGMAWERAKAELYAIMQADFAPDGGGSTPFEASKARRAWDAKCERRRFLVKAFVAQMEDEELYR